MSSKDSFADRRKAHEEEYFHKKEKELLEKARRRAALQSDREAMADALGVADDEILASLQELGYTKETVALLHLVPVLEVAWAEGKITDNERDLILDAARLRGVAEGSPAHAELIGWLDTRPSEDFFEQTLRVISALVDHLPAEERLAHSRDILDYSTKIAEASGSLLSAIGLGSKVSDEERAVLERIARSLE